MYYGTVSNIYLFIPIVFFLKQSAMERVPFAMQIIAGGCAELRRAGNCVRRVLWAGREVETNIVTFQTYVVYAPLEGRVQKTKKNHLW